MPVPNSPHLYRRAIPVEPPPDEDDDFENPLTKPPKPVYSSKYEGGKYTSGVEAFLHEDGSGLKYKNVRKTSWQGGQGGLTGGCHRSRDRTRQSAVQRLVERKLAQREKEKEKERECWASQSQYSHTSHARSDYFSRERDRSGTRSENGFILGAGRCSSPSKENLEPDEWPFGEGGKSQQGQRRRAARSCSASRYRDTFADEATAKTYITIGPGKPTRIREHSPAKSAKLSSDENVTSARERSAQSRNSSPLKVFDLNRSISPSPQRKTRENHLNENELKSRPTERKNDLLRNTSPLKSTNFLKTFRASKGDLLDTVGNDLKRKSHPFTSEKTFFINQPRQAADQNNNKERRLSEDILNNTSRASPESDSSQGSTSTLSSFRSPSSSLSSSSESFDSDKLQNVQLSQRRISLEQRLNARVRLNSPERSVTVTRKVSETKTSSNGTRSTSVNTSTFIYRKSSTSASLFPSKCPSRPEQRKTERPVPASRKISLPQPQVAGRRPQPTPRRRSLSTLISSPERLDLFEALECLTTRIAVAVTVTPGWEYLVLTVISMTAGLEKIVGPAPVRILLTTLTSLTNILNTVSGRPGQRVL